MGVHTIEKEAKIEEAIRDERIRLKCLELVMAHGHENSKGTPWKTAQMYFYWVKYQKPDMQVL